MWREEGGGAGGSAAVCEATLYIALYNHFPRTRLSSGFPLTPLCPLPWLQEAWNLVQEFQALVNTLSMGFSAQEAQVGVAWWGEDRQCEEVWTSGVRMVWTSGVRTVSVRKCGLVG